MTKRRFYALLPTWTLNLKVPPMPKRKPIDWPHVRAGAKQVLVGVVGLFLIVTGGVFLA